MVLAIVELRNVEGTQAALGWAGGHTMVIDRPEGKAGGMGLGFNGAQLLGLALGGCLCNDLRYVAHDMGVAIEAISMTVRIELDGDPLLVTSATINVSCKRRDGLDPRDVIERASRGSAVANSLERGVPVSIELGESLRPDGD